MTVCSLGTILQATQRQHEECVKILLDNGADSNAVDAYQNSALHYAVYNNNLTIASKLLAFNADTEIKAKVAKPPTFSLKYLKGVDLDPVPHAEADAHIP